MPVFKGEFEHTLDSKNRLFLPVKFHEGLTDSFVLWKWFFAPCLYILTEEAFGDVSRRLEESLSLMDEDAALIQRTLYSGAADVTVDKQGRILIPAGHKAYAGLEEREAVVVGAGNHVEVWSRANWADAQAQTNTDALRRAVKALREQGIKL